jgi:hypothetical protein
MKITLLVIILFSKHISTTTSKFTFLHRILLHGLSSPSTSYTASPIVSLNNTQLISFDYFPIDLKYEDTFNYIDSLCHSINSTFINSTLLATSIHNGIYDNITYDEFHSLASETAAYMSTDHPEYGKLASKITILSLHKTCLPLNFSSAVSFLYHHIDTKTGENTTNLSLKLYNKVMKNRDKIDREIDNQRDFDFDYFGIKTLEK